MHQTVHRWCVWAYRCPWWRVQHHDLPQRLQKINNH